jgi:hypothetical protein
MARRLVVAFSLLALVAISSLAAGTAPAWAGHPVDWTKIGKTPYFWSQPGLERSSNGRLNIVWVRRNASDETHFDLVYSRFGSSKEASNVIVANENVIDPQPDLVRDPDVAANCNLLAVHGGTAPGNVFGVHTFESDPNAAGAEGSAWLPRETITPDSGVVGATALRGCKAFVAVTGGQGLRVITDQNVESAANYEAPLATCCAYVPNLAASLPADVNVAQRLWLAWYSIPEDSGVSECHCGVYVQEVDTATGEPIGSATRMPGTVTLFHGKESGVFDQVRIPMAARPDDDGVYVLYTGGYPTATKLLLWRVGDSSSTVLATNRDGLGTPALGVGQDGSLWALWSSGSRVWLRHSSPDLQYWSPSYFGTAPKPPGTPTVRTYNLTVDALDPATGSRQIDVIGNFASGGGTALYHSQFISIVGTTSADTLTGGPYVDFIAGGEGNDVLNGAAGGDILSGQGGKDKLHGGPGSDKLYGGPGIDTCFVTPGDQTFSCEHVQNE